jgi:hypothetical protein
LVFAVWVAAGFHVNVNERGLAGFDPTAEVLNEGSKTLWAAAYLVPLLSFGPLRLRWPQRGLPRLRSASK